MPPSSEALFAAVTAAAPRAGFALAVLLFGWLAARLSRRAVGRLLLMLRFDEAAERSGVDDFLLRGGVRQTARTILAGLVYWTVLAASAVACISLLGVADARELVANVFSFGLRAVAATVIVTFGVAFAGMVKGAVAAYLNNLGIEGARPLSEAAQAAVILFVVSLALEQLRIGSRVVIVGFAMIFGGVCLALAIAFGLGGRKWAARIWDKWME